MSDVITQLEREFPFPDLLSCEYFQRHRRGYYGASVAGLLNPNRNYVLLLRFLSEVFDYNAQHAKSFAKRLRGSSLDWPNCEAIFSEIIVYRHYLVLVHEGRIRKLELNKTQADLTIERLDGSKVYFEVLCVMPQFPLLGGRGFAAWKLTTHTQDSPTSIRQKLLRKANKQKQFCAPLEKNLVIELNDISIAGDFHVLSSLSGGYTLKIDRITRQGVSRGYNWSDSVFNDPSLKFLRSVIYFSVGDFRSRRHIANPNFDTKLVATSARDILPVADDFLLGNN